MQEQITPINITSISSRRQQKWFVLRDLKRPNAKERAYQILQKMGYDVYTPLVEQVVIKKGASVKELVPFLPDLVFVYASRDQIDPIISKTATLQYRYIKGGKYQEGMTVDNHSMNQFMQAAKVTASCKYYHAEELPKLKVGAKIKIVGGAFDGCEGELLESKRTGEKRILMRIGGVLAASFEFVSDFITVV